jgi:hypothetical protein
MNERADGVERDALVAAIQRHLTIISSLRSQNTKNER